MIEDSVGQHRSTFAGAVLGMPDQARHKYLHLSQSGRSILAWAYPNIYLTAFTKWLWGDYFSTHFPTYQYHRTVHRPASITIRPTTQEVSSLTLLVHQAMRAGERCFLSSLKVCCLHQFLCYPSRFAGWCDLFRTKDEL